MIQCVTCRRVYSKERFQTLDPFGFRRFWRHLVLDLKWCACGTLMGVEFDSNACDPKWLQKMLPPLNALPQQNLNMAAQNARKVRH